MRFILTFILLACTIQISFAQPERSKKEKTDSLTKHLMEDSARIYRPRLAKPYLRLENRYSFINKKPVNLVGFLAGATFLEKHVVCAGYYILNRNVQKSIELIDENNIITREYVTLNYFVFSYQYVLFNKRFLQINIPVEIGYGIYDTHTTDSYDVFIKKSNGSIVPISTGLQFIFKPIKWIGISCVGGYRHAVQEKNISLNFTGFYYSFGIWVDARHITRWGRYQVKKTKYRRDLKGL